MGEKEKSDLCEIKNLNRKVSIFKKVPYDHKGFTLITKSLTAIFKKSQGKNHLVKNRSNLTFCHHTSLLGIKDTDFDLVPTHQKKKLLKTLLLVRHYCSYSHKHTLHRYIGLTLYAKRATIIHKVIEVFFLVISEGQSSGNVMGYKKIMREESHTNNKK